MTNLARIIMVFLFTISASAQSATGNQIAMNSTTSLGVFEFETETIDYGTINQNTNGERSFTFKNTGNSPIIISKVKASCGCTVASKPEQPIMPGETGVINVKYATNRVGSFSKNITVTSNASESNKVIRIKGNILKVAKTNLATNKSIVSAN